jgi:hypothetical protein
MHSDGSPLRQLTTDARFDASWPRVSPDRQHILFQRTPVGTGGSNYREMSLWMMRADGARGHDGARGQALPLACTTLKATLVFFSSKQLENYLGRGRAAASRKRFNAAL